MSHPGNPNLPAQGLYALWSPDGRSVYVGCSIRLQKRWDDHLTSIRLGCRFEVVQATNDLTKAQLHKLEDALILRYRQEGFAVVNETNAEIARSRGVANARARDPEQWARVQKAGRAARSENVRKRKEAKALSSKDHSDAALHG